MQADFTEDEGTTAFKTS